MTEIEQVGDGRWEITNNYTNENEEDFDGANNSAKLFERSRIKALAGECKHNSATYSSLTRHLHLLAKVNSSPVFTILPMIELLPN